MYKFHELETAKRFAYRCEKIMMIVLGDDGLYWVTTGKEASRLVKAGYEYAD